MTASVTDTNAAADGSAGSPLVSVVIAARNEARAIEGCLAGLVRQRIPADQFDVILVDGMSDDGTVAVAEAFARCHALPLRVLRNPLRSTPAGMNLGIQATTGAVVVVLGARAHIDPNFLSASVAALQDTGAAAVGGVVRTVAGGKGLVAEAIALAQRSPFGVGDARYRYAECAGEVDTVNYGAYRREVFARIGGFDESMQWVEDDELNYRLRKSGGRIYLDPAINVDYAARPTLAGLWKQRYLWGFNKPRVAHRHPGQVRLRHGVPALFVLALAGGALLAITGGPRRAPLAALTLAYGGASLVATVRLGRHIERTLALVLTPLAFAVMHTAYGCGTIAGAVALAAMRREQAASRRHTSAGP